MVLPRSEKKGALKAKFERFFDFADEKKYSFFYCNLFATIQISMNLNQAFSEKDF